MNAIDHQYYNIKHTNMATNIQHVIKSPKPL